jgi:hypothetical protein
MNQRPNYSRHQPDSKEEVKGHHGRGGKRGRSDDEHSNHHRSTLPTRSTVHANNDYNKSRYGRDDKNKYPQSHYKGNYQVSSTHEYKRGRDRGANRSIDRN